MAGGSHSLVEEYLSSFRSPVGREPGQATRSEELTCGGISVRQYINEFWTARQRQASSIHEISYRACFKPQLPAFFIRLLTGQGDPVYDPFSGRGTTPIEAGLLGRRVLSNDVNPLNRILAEPRFFIPSTSEVKARLDQIPLTGNQQTDMDLSMFYHPRTHAEILALREYLRERNASGREDHLDRWIRMVATNRLSGHSKGFFSVYTFPPNQAVSRQEQLRINERRAQKPEYRDTKHIILRKTKSLLRNVSAEQITALCSAGGTARFLAADAGSTPAIDSDSVQLTVTSPPFLDIVSYGKDNWLRCWFNGLDAEAVAESITMPKSLEQWTAIMGRVFRELYRVTRRGGWVAFEVGEVRRGTVRLDEEVVPLGLAAGFSCEAIVINQQEFTKTSNIWGVSNNSRGTNTNRIVLFEKR